MEYRYIIRCSCGGAKTKAETTFKLLYSNEEIPETISKDKARELINIVPNTDAGARLSAIVKRSGRYAYYLRFKDDGTLLDSADLMAGKKGV